MKKFLVLFALFNFSAFAGPFADCSKEDECQYKDCAAQVVESVDNTSMATCREVYKKVDGKHELAYHEIKIMSQRIDPETKKSVVTGNTLRVK